MQRLGEPSDYDVLHQQSNLQSGLTSLASSADPQVIVSSSRTPTPQHTSSNFGNNGDSLNNGDSTAHHGQQLLSGISEEHGSSGKISAGSLHSGVDCFQNGFVGGKHRDSLNVRPTGSNTNSSSSKNNSKKAYPKERHVPCEVTALPEADDLGSDYRGDFQKAHLDSLEVADIRAGDSEEEVVEVLFEFSSY